MPTSDRIAPCRVTLRQTHERTVDMISASASGEALDELAQQRDFSKRSIASRTRVYIGRRHSQDKLEAFVSSGEVEPCLVSGPAGSGRSAVQAKFVSVTGVSSRRQVTGCRICGMQAPRRPLSSKGTREASEACWRYLMGAYSRGDAGSLCQIGWGCGRTAARRRSALTGAQVTITERRARPRTAPHAFRSFVSSRSD
jgi:hypothetical protein